MQSDRIDEGHRIVAGALAASNVGTWAWRIDEDVLRCDPVAAAMLGLPAACAPDGATYGLFRGRLHPGDRARIDAMVVALRRRGGIYTAQYRIVPAPGCVRRIHACGRFAPDPDGAVREASGVVIDVTEPIPEGLVGTPAPGLPDFGEAQSGIDRVAEHALAMRNAADDLPAVDLARLRPLMDATLHAIGRCLADSLDVPEPAQLH